LTFFFIDAILYKISEENIMSIKKKLLIIGAGNIGIAISNMLSQVHYDISLSDINAAALADHRILPTINTFTLAVSDKKALRTALRDHEYVINACPYSMAYIIATSAIESNTHYFDLTEDINQSFLIKGLDDGQLKSALVPQCGLAPGYISIAANHLAMQFDVVHDIKMRVGALPRYPTNMLKYNTTWSIDGLVNEYIHECNALENGKLVSTAALGGYETFALDGEEYEAFNTSGGLGTMCETWAGKARGINYKTMRYPGHLHLIKFLINDMRMDEDALKDLFADAIHTTNQDVVVVFIEVTGRINDKLTTRTMMKKIYNNDKWSAIQLTTASGICVMVEAHRKELIPSVGFVKQENLSFADFNIIDSIELSKVWQD
jgi:saccharopine dehydrogenase-like NADP-dependent oxidoreductase